MNNNSDKDIVKSLGEASKKVAEMSMEQAVEKLNHLMNCQKIEFAILLSLVMDHGDGAGLLFRLALYRLYPS